MSFPDLFRLPDVALRVVLRLMDLHEAIQFSLCSKKSKNLIKFECRLKYTPRLSLNHRQKSSYMWIFDAEEPYGSYTFEPRSSPPISDNIRKQIIAEMDQMPESVKSRKIGDATFTIWEENLYSEDFSFDYRTFWEDPDAGILIFVSYLVDLLGIDVQDLRVTSDSKSIVDWIIRRQNSIDKLFYVGKVREIEAMWPREFRRRCIDGSNTDLTNEDLNKMLLRGDLIHVDITILGSIDFEMVTRGLNAKKVEREEPISYVEDPDFSYTIGTSWDYQKDDGTMASVFLIRDDLEGESDFGMVTWPDSEGNTYDS
uniref:F-box domain-containing protein n=1 Tax=Caenorhabditis tropicalis TaxID=1561998 RepID=A0A1I7TYB5_9PELO